ncbi:MAG: dTMP kinase [Anaerolineaceae bacterium]|nr:dTMP kinase [Anaerolineaceae bacterium]
MTKQLSIPGKFIVLEGLDGAGTTTQCERLTAWGQQQGFHTIATREPTDNAWGRQARRALRGELPLSPLALAFTFMADRAHHVGILAQQSQPENSLIVSDRYLFSYLAYQQIDAAKPLDWFIETAQPLPLPDLTIYVKVPAERCVERMQTGRTQIERFERLATLQQVEAAYERVFAAYDARCKIAWIDGDRSVEAVEADVIQAVQAMLSNS